MSRRCELNNSKAVMSGHSVSHSNIKTKRKFLPNIQSFSLLSESLNAHVTFNASPSSIRSVEHNDGLDNYLIKSCPTKLSKKAKDLRKLILKNKSNKELENKTE